MQPLREGSGRLSVTGLGFLLVGDLGTGLDVALQLLDEGWVLVAQVSMVLDGVQGVVGLEVEFIALSHQGSGVQGLEPVHLDLESAFAILGGEVESTPGVRGTGKQLR